MEENRNLTSISYTAAVELVELEEQSDEIAYYLDPDNLAQPTIPTIQLRWLLFGRCLMNQGTYCIRHLPPYLTTTLATKIAKISNHDEPPLNQPLGKLTTHHRCL
jgi:hypothetical protein